jgi:hypothetical protein
MIKNNVNFNKHQIDPTTSSALSTHTSRHNHRSDRLSSHKHNKHRDDSRSPHIHHDSDSSDEYHSKKRKVDDRESESIGDNITPEQEDSVLIGPKVANPQDNALLHKTKVRGRGSVGSNRLDQYFAGLPASELSYDTPRSATTTPLVQTSVSSKTKKEKKDKKLKKEKKHKDKKEKKHKKDKKYHTSSPSHSNAIENIT